MNYYGPFQCFCFQNNAMLQKAEELNGTKFANATEGEDYDPDDPDTKLD